MYSASYVWARILSRLDQQLTEVMTSAWLDDAEVVQLTQEELVIYSPAEFRQEQIRIHCASIIEEALREQFHSSARLVVWGETEMKTHREKQAGKRKSYFSPRFSFDSFIAGTSNELPLKVACAVARAPGTEVYNPLFFYGPPGVGKTHLLYAIANSVSNQHPGLKIVCIKGDQFTNELVKAISTGSTPAFRARYRETDVLLVDDIQFIAGKESTQEEFFHTFNALYEGGKQIVLTADRKPSEMATLEDRLRSRFGVGIMVGIQPPDYETRLLITKEKARQLELRLGQEALQYIASTLTDNIRQIEGALKKLRACRDLAGMELTEKNVSRCIEDMRTAEDTALVTPALILRNVSRYYGVEEETLRGPQRSRNISEPRQIAMYLMRQMLQLSQDEIAGIFSRERTTVLHSIKQVDKALQLKGNRLDPIVQDIRAGIAACVE